MQTLESLSKAHDSSSETTCGKQIWHRLYKTLNKSTFTTKTLAADSLASPGLKGPSGLEADVACVIAATRQPLKDEMKAVAKEEDEAKRFATLGATMGACEHDIPIDAEDSIVGYETAESAPTATAKSSHILGSDAKANQKYGHSASATDSGRAPGHVAPILPERPAQRLSQVGSLQEELALAVKSRAARSAAANQEAHHMLPASHRPQSIPHLLQKAPTALASSMPSVDCTTAGTQGGDRAACGQPPTAPPPPPKAMKMQGKQHPPAAPPMPAKGALTLSKGSKAAAASLADLATNKPGSTQNDMASMAAKVSSWFTDSMAVLECCNEIRVPQ